MTDQVQKTFTEVQKDIKGLVRKNLRGVTDASDPFTISEITSTNIKCTDGVSLPIAKIEQLWNSFHKYRIVQATKVLGESGSHRSRPETVLANLPYIEYYKSGNSKYIAFVGKNTHDIGSKRLMTKDSFKNFLDNKHLPILQGTITYNTNYNNKQGFDYNKIVFGAPGTGKSFKVSENKDSVIYDTSHKKIGGYERVTFYSDYSYAKFVGSYRPSSDDNNQITYKFTPGPFMRLLAQAYKSSIGKAKPYILIIEEINRADAAAVFGDVFQLLDRTSQGVSQYGIQTPQEIREYLAHMVGGKPSDYSEIKLPNNLFIWATMNSADQGVYPLDTAFKRRWSFDYIGINDNENKVSNYNVMLGTGNYNKKYNWNKMRKAINDILIYDCHLEEDKLLGPFFLSFSSLVETKQDELNSEEFSKEFKNKILMYLFNDAGRMFRKKLFPNAKTMMYSEVCRAFDLQGPKIFGTNFEKYYQQEQ